MTLGGKYRELYSSQYELAAGIVKDRQNNDAIPGDRPGKEERRTRAGNDCPVPGKIIFVAAYPVLRAR